MKKLPIEKENIFVRHRFAITFFVFTVLYQVFIANRLKVWQLNDITYSTYCVDFSFGFASKILPGAIFRRLLGSHASFTAATIYTTVLVLLFFVCLALVLERFLLRMAADERTSALVLIVFFLTGAYTFCIFTKWVGIADTYWVYFTLLFVVFLENKYLRFLIPGLFVLSIMIHFSALVFYMPLFAILLLYRACVAQNKNEKGIFIGIFALSILLALITFFVLILNESHWIGSMEAFNRKLNANAGGDVSFYFDYAFFHRWGEYVIVPESVNAMQPSPMKFFYLFYYQLKLVSYLLKQDAVSGSLSTTLGVLLLAPIVVLFARFHWRRFKIQGNKFKRFCAFLMLLQFPFAFIMGLVFAIPIDMTRYYTHAFLGLFVCVFSVLYHEADMRKVLFETMHSLQDSLAIKLYCLAYAYITLLPIV